MFNLTKMFTNLELEHTYMYKRNKNMIIIKIATINIDNKT